ncbi:DMT family transporter [Roseateles saccharophilus]|uniref:Drug/metabolite transporter (DMT)-like permease n=1 Tax=Roseateles saccharophilus TaxID=304 RepID=A0A4R3UVG6_ROSSA|nr:DMT family transporter [Roseateles saccharophilus]MDG0835341.1 DMT family transporter [Roseateles saccharophilus]TCU96146.1 drug/metabolite transporter (DMT)-like permease [Roseateles saccharophilus]
MPGFSTSTSAIPTTSASDATRGLLLGVAGVVMFALSIPMTRLAGGSAAAPQLDPAFVAFGRAVVAGLLSVAYLAATGARRPRGAEWRLLAMTAGGVVFGWPLLSGLAVRHVDAVHAAVVSGVLPLATAVIAALVLRQRPSRGFWACALAGLALVVGFAAWRGAGGLEAADGLLLGAVVCASAGYVSGARLSGAMSAEQVICWVLVISLPVTLPLALWTRPTAPVAPSAWAGFAYVSLFSMWIGFFAWYRGLALGGTLRVSQVQVLQPFLSMLFAVPLLGERLDATTLVFAVAVLAVVWLGKRQPVGQPKKEARP